MSLALENAAGVRLQRDLGFVAGLHVAHFVRAGHGDHPLLMVSPITLMGKVHRSHLDFEKTSRTEKAQISSRISSMAQGVLGCCPPPCTCARSSATVLRNASSSLSFASG